MKSGVYKIINNTDGKVYIGSSTDTRRRIGHHRSLLRRGIHFNIHLQRAWNRDGEAAFSFEVVCWCESSDTLKYEQEFLNHERATVGNKGVYNLAIDTSAPTKGMRHSEESRQKISVGNRGKKRSEMTRQRMCAAQRGRKCTDKAKANISKSKSGVNHPNFGKSRSLKTREKISAAQKGRPFTASHRMAVREASRNRTTSKLTAELVQQIRKEYANGSISQVAWSQIWRGMFPRL